MSTLDLFGLTLAFVGAMPPPRPPRPRPDRATWAAALLFGGVCLGAKIAPIFYNTMEDAGALPIELDVSQMNMGDTIELRPYEGKALKDGQVIAEFKVKSDVLFDEVRAGGRIPLIVGRGLTTMKPGEQKGIMAVVPSADDARQTLLDAGVECTEVDEQVWGRFVFFTDPDQNAWTYQELPSRG